MEELKIEISKDLELNESARYQNCYVGKGNTPGCAVPS
jgi:hypothetical protein